MSIPVQSRRQVRQVTSLSDYFFQLWRDQFIGLALRFTLIMCLSLMIVVLVFYWRLPPEIPLTYSRPWGVDQLVPSFFLFILYALVLLLIVVNSLLAAFLYIKEQLLAQLLAWTSALIVFLVFMTVLRVVLLVT